MSDAIRADYQDLRTWFRDELKNHRAEMQDEMRGLREDLSSVRRTLTEDIVLTKVLEGKMKTWGSLVAGGIVAINTILLFLLEVWKHGGKL